MAAHEHDKSRPGVDRGIEPPGRILITTDGLSGADRFAYFREEALTCGPVPVEFRCEDPASFSGRIDGVDLGTVTLVHLSGQAAGRRETHRGPALIRRSDQPAYRLLLNRGSAAGYQHNNHDITLDRHDLTLIDTSLPNHGWSDTGTDRSMYIRFPPRLLPLPTRAIRPLLGARLCGQSGIGAVLAATMTQAARGIDSYRPADALRLSTTLLDLLGALLAHELETHNALAPESRQRALMCQIQAYIQQHLHDPTLSPTSIAAAHHISTRSLHTLFQTHDLTVAAWIRARRLDRCRHDLADPRLTTRPVHAIAARWGFTSPAHFSRLFKTTFDLSPNDYRQANQQTPGTPPKHHHQPP